jgi:RNA polymerase sigma-70 factor (ECF subfamily)
MEILCTCQRRADTRRMAEVDAALVLRVLDGDRSAFETLLSMHAIRARAVARSVLGDDPAVDDALQEAFVRAYDHLGQLGEPSTFPAWLSTIVRNEAVTWLRRNARVRNVGIEMASEAPHAETSSENPHLETLRAALLKLSIQYREILALKYEANLNYDQIAETLGLSQANVEKRLYRARQALLSLMPETGASPPGDEA